MQTSDVPRSIPRATVDLCISSSSGSGHTRVQDWRVCTAAGLQACQVSVSHWKNRGSLRLIPFGSVACPLPPRPRPAGSASAKGKWRGGASCALPLPVDTGLPVLINAGFELSSNRRTLWIGDDMRGDGEVKSHWNTALLQSSLAEGYVDLILRSQAHCVEPADLTASREVTDLAQYYQLFPPASVPHPWDSLATAFYELATNYPVLSPLGVLPGTEWVSPKDCVFVTSSGRHLASALAQMDRLTLVEVPQEILEAFSAACPSLSILTPKFVRDHLVSNAKQLTSGLGGLLQDVEAARPFLEYCLQDLGGAGDPEGVTYRSLWGLQLLPLSDGRLGVFGPPTDANLKDSTADNKENKKDAHALFLPGATPEEMELLRPLCHRTINEAGLPPAVLKHLHGPLLHANTNIAPLGPQALASAVVPTLFPPSYHRSVSQIGWRQHVSVEWLRAFWQYMAYHRSAWDSLGLDEWPLIPAMVRPGDPDGSPCIQALVTARHLRLVSRQGLPSAVVAPLLMVGCCLVDSSTAATQHPAICRIVHESKPCGVLEALHTACPKVSNPAGVSAWLRNSFGPLTPEFRDALAVFFSRQEARPAILRRPELMNLLRLLPIWPLEGALIPGTGQPQHGGLCTPSEESETAESGCMLSPIRLQPPQGVSAAVLKNKFVRYIPGLDTAAYAWLGVNTVPHAQFYEEHFIDQLETLQPDLRDAEMIKLLLSLHHHTSESDRLVIALRSTPCVPSAAEGAPLCCASDLYDRRLHRFGVLPEAGFPAPAFTQPKISSVLQRLGLKMALSLPDLVAAAQEIHRQSLAINARNPHVSDPEVQALRKRGLGILDYMKCYDTQLGNEYTADDTNVFSTLCTLSWVPVCHELGSCDLPKAPSHLIGPCAIVAPGSVRLWVDVPLCSSTHGLLHVDAPHPQGLMMEALGWKDPLSPGILADQLVALVSMDRSQWGPSGSPDKARRAWSSIFKAIEEHIPREVLRKAASRALDPSVQAEDGEQYGNDRQGPDMVSSELSDLLSECEADLAEVLTRLASVACVLHEGQFVHPSRLSLTNSGSAAPDCAPFLRVLPAGAPHQTMCLLLGARRTFGPPDYVAALAMMAADSATKSTAERLGACPPETAVAMACAVAEYLAEQPKDSFDITQVMLPDHMGVFAGASCLCENDVEWMADKEPAELLAALPPAVSVSLVHPHLTSRTAQRLGVKSLRMLLADDRGFVSEVQTPDLLRVRREMGQLMHFAMGPAAAPLKDADLAELMCLAVSDFIEMADACGAHKVDVVLDTRLHKAVSVLRPSLAHLQGPALVFKMDRCLPPAQLARLQGLEAWAASCYGNPGQGLEKSRALRSGYGLARGYMLTDTILIVSGDSLTILDPHRHHALAGVDGTATGQSFRFASASGSGLPLRFPDQFVPFVELGLDTSAPFEGTIVRLPLRSPSSDLDLWQLAPWDPPLHVREVEGHSLNQPFASMPSGIVAFLEKIQHTLPTSLLFMASLTRISSVVVDSSGKQLPVCDTCFTSSNPLSLRSELLEDTSWKADSWKTLTLPWSRFKPKHRQYYADITTACPPLSLGPRGKPSHDRWVVVQVLGTQNLLQLAITTKKDHPNLPLVPPLGGVAALVSHSPSEDSEVNPLSNSSCMPVDVHRWLRASFLRSGGVYSPMPQSSLLAARLSEEGTPPRLPVHVYAPGFCPRNGVPERYTSILNTWDKHMWQELVPEAYQFLLSQCLAPKLSRPSLLYAYLPSPPPDDESDAQHPLEVSLFRHLAKHEEIFLLGSRWAPVSAGHFLLEPLGDAARSHFASHTTIFDVPTDVAKAFVRYGAGAAKTFLPANARALFRPSARPLGIPPGTAASILSFACSDLTPAYAKELYNLRLLPLACGQTVSFGSQEVVLATSAQQALIRQSTCTFIHPQASSCERTMNLLSSQKACSALRLTPFSMHTLSAEFSRCVRNSFCVV